MDADKLNILLVDDQPAKLLTYEAILGGLGENLIKARSGREALEILLKTDIAVVLMDVCMPDLDGFELAGLIHQHPRCQRAAIIFISAVHMTNLDQVRGYECGAVDYVSVPVVPEILRARVGVFADLYRKSRDLERLNRDLELRVEERTEELERDLAERMRLEQALRDADSRKDEFLAILAHELRNPLAPIRSAVEIMGRRATDDPQTVWCHGVIERQIEHLTRLVDDLLDVSRITRGKIKLERQPTDVATIVARAVETNRPLIDSRKHDLSVQLPGETLEVDGDITRLAQVVGNLLNNASKYTPEGGRIALGVETEVAPDGRAVGEDSAAGAPAQRVVIRVRDTGIGIPARMLPQVFDLFTQMDHSVEHSQGGLGIGLGLVRLLTEMHGGTVEAHSEGAGQGSEFVVRLPLLHRLAPDAPTSTSTSSSSSPVPPLGAAMYRRILVVDDNLDAAETLAAILRLGGSEVVTAHDGLEAVAIAERFLPELVLLDIGMPRLNGYDAARRIRAAPWGRNMVLVAQTGWGQEEDRRRTRDAGFDGHLTKPVDHAKLAQLLTGNILRSEPIGEGAS
jgi:signal transduction histidine kinase